MRAAALQKSEGGRKFYLLHCNIDGNDIKYKEMTLNENLRIK